MAPEVPRGAPFANVAAASASGRLLGSAIPANATVRAQPAILARLQTFPAAAGEDEQQHSAPHCSLLAKEKTIRPEPAPSSEGATAA